MQNIFNNFFMFCNFFITWALYWTKFYCKEENSTWDISHRIPGIYHFRGKQSDTEKTKKTKTNKKTNKKNNNNKNKKTVVYIGTRHFPRKLSRTNMVFEDKLILFNSLSENSRSGYYCTIFMILVGCLVTPRIRGMTVVIFLFHTGTNRPVVRIKQP